MRDIDFDVIWCAYGALLTFLDVIDGPPSSAARSIAFSKDFEIFRKIFRNQKDLSKNHQIQMFRIRKISFEKKGMDLSPVMELGII